jgi:hypothetical protein
MRSARKIVFQTSSKATLQQLKSLYNEYLWINLSFNWVISEIANRLSMSIFNCVDRHWTAQFTNWSNVSRSDHVVSRFLAHVTENRLHYKVIAELALSRTLFHFKRFLIPTNRSRRLLKFLEKNIFFLYFQQQKETQKNCSLRAENDQQHTREEIKENIYREMRKTTETCLLNKRNETSEQYFTQ